LLAGSRGCGFPSNHRPKTINRFSNFSVKEKDEASRVEPFSRGFAECLYSPFCREMEAFLLSESSSSSSSSSSICFSEIAGEVEDEDENEDEDEVISALVSNRKTRPRFGVDHWKISVC